MVLDENTDANNSQRRIAPKRKRENLNARKNTNSTASPFSRRSPPREAPRGRPDDDDGEASPPRKLKRPGGGSRIAAASREAAERERQAREEESRRNAAERKVPGASIVAEHYNAVPERGRDWRQTESKIAGLRSLNNWIKSTLIQKFSRPEIPVHDLKVLDLACGKGGDLGKWKKAPQVPALYVGCDIAQVSVEQAQKRYEEDLVKSRGRSRMQAEFYVQDTFGHSLTEIPIVRNIGFNPNAGPSNGVIQGGMMSGGFDVVSMMFALHYSFESEKLARGMLTNVAGSLKKGGRFIGVMPNSDVIASHIRARNKTSQPVQQKEAKANGDDGVPEEPADDWDPEKPSGGHAPQSEQEEPADDWDPEKPSERPMTSDEWDPEKPSEQPALSDDWDPEKPAEKPPAPSAEDAQEDLTFGNDIYNVRVPAAHIPPDGVFRPPFGWKYDYFLEEAVQVPEFVVPWEAFRALAEDYGLELMYRKGFREVFEDESIDRELGELAYRMKVMSRNPREGLLVKPNEMEAAAFYHAFCFYKT